jgi:hypothetical protein
MLALAAVALVFMVSGMVLSSLMFSFRQTSLSVPPLGGVTGDGIIDLF